MEKYKKYLDELLLKYPSLKECETSILRAFDILKKCYINNNKIVVAGNGGSCADGEHIVGELMKGFMKKRPLEKVEKESIIAYDNDYGYVLSEKIQKTIPCISLNNHSCLNSAFINDVDEGENLYLAQQLYGYGLKGDVFIAISTSGNSKNVIYAAVMAKVKGLTVIALTGKNGGILSNYSDVVISVPLEKTYEIQELHLPIYHCICAMLEEYFF